MSSVATVPALTSDKLQRCMSLPPDAIEKQPKVGSNLLRALHAKSSQKMTGKIGKKGFSFDDAEKYELNLKHVHTDTRLVEAEHSSDEEDATDPRLKTKSKRKKKRRGSLARPLTLNGIKAFTLDRNMEAPREVWNVEEEPEQARKRNPLLKRAFRKKRVELEESSNLKPAMSMSSLVDIVVNNNHKQNEAKDKKRQVQDLSSINIVDRAKLEGGFFDKITRSPFISRKKQSNNMLSVVPASTPVSPNAEICHKSDSDFTSTTDHSTSNERLNAETMSIYNEFQTKSLSSWISGSVTLPRRFRKNKQRPTLPINTSSGENSLKTSPKIGKHEDQAENSIVNTLLTAEAKLGKEVTAEDIFNDNYFGANVPSSEYWNEYGSCDTLSSGDTPNIYINGQSPPEDFDSVSVNDQGYATWDGRLNKLQHQKRIGKL